MEKKLVRSDRFILLNLNQKITKYSKEDVYLDSGDLIAILEDLKSELCLGSEIHDEDGNLIENAKLHKDT